MGLIRRQVVPGTRSRVGESGRDSPHDFYVITASKGRHEVNGQLAERLFSIKRSASSSR